MENYLKIDINADVGEGTNNEELLFPLISSCNIACGGHAGDYNTMEKIVRLAVENNLKIGAHPSYPDKENFGRKKISISKKELIKSIFKQVNSLKNILDEKKINLNHIKPHGALYNYAFNDTETSDILIQIAKDFKTKLFTPYKSVTSKRAKNNSIEYFNEVFLDRNYNSDLTLVSRSNKNALVTDSDEMISHAYNILKNNNVISVNGTKVKIEYDTLCIHGDNPNSIQLLKSLHKRLKKWGFKT